MLILSPQSSNAKLAKNSAVNDQWETSILYLTPANLADPSVNLCPASSPGCRAACLYTAGRGQMNTVQSARLRKTKRFIQDQSGFMRDLVADLERLEHRQERTDVRQAIRLNGTSDIDWENILCVRDGRRYFNVMQAFPSLQFYDYTKRVVRCAVGYKLPRNYHLTLSESEVNYRHCTPQIPVNIATVFHGPDLPSVWRGRPVIDGTQHDMRFLDPFGVVVGLLAKGKAKHDKTHFVK
jgi:hypothetical protein